MPNAIAEHRHSGHQQSLVERLLTACGGSYSPETRRKYYISGRQWAEAYHEQSGRLKVSFPTAVDRFITLWEMAGEAVADPIIHEATEALKSGAGASVVNNAQEIFEANKELLTLHELIAHRLVQILIGTHRGRKFFATS
ncbi:MAG: hypothetical protein WA419_13305 [Silvibacterium sp.]